MVTQHTSIDYSTNLKKKSNEFLYYSFYIFRPMVLPYTKAKHYVNLHKKLNNISKMNENFVEVRAKS